MPLRGLRLSDDLKTRLEQVQKLRGYRSVNAFILEAIEEKLQRTDAVVPSLHVGGLRRCICLAT
jgi:hypothetical protein